MSESNLEPLRAPAAESDAREEKDSPGKARAVRREPVVLKLSDPITIGKTTYAEITVQPLRAWHMREFPVGDLKALTLGDFMKIGGKASGVSDHVLAQLGIEDALALVEVLSNFFPIGPPTGPTASSKSA